MHVDGEGPAEAAEPIADRLPNATYLQLSDLNHLSPFIDSDPHRRADPRRGPAATLIDPPAAQPSRAQPSHDSPPTTRARFAGALADFATPLP